MNKQGAGKVLRSRAVTVQLVLLSILFCVEVEAETTEQTHTYNQPKIFPIKVTQGVAVDGGFFTRLVIPVSISAINKRGRWLRHGPQTKD